VKNVILRKYFGFILIELLIVVAIIGILAAIAVPNFLTPQIRAKVATVKEEQRSIGVALESFRVFEGRLPYVNEYYDNTRMRGDIVTQFGTITRTLTSPVSFIAALPGDPFRSDSRAYHYAYLTNVTTCWVNGSVGPNRTFHGDFFSGQQDNWKNESYFCFGPQVPSNQPGSVRACDPRSFLPPSQGGENQIIQGGANSKLYDPTNGTTSAGDIIKSGP